MRSRTRPFRTWPRQSTPRYHETTGGGLRALSIQYPARQPNDFHEVRLADQLDYILTGGTIADTPTPH